MEFAHDNHQATFERVREYLGELFDRPYHDEATGHFYVRYGSTVLEISVEPYGPEEVIVVIMAYCVQGADVDESLLRGLLELNHQLPIGAFSVVGGNDVFFSYALFGHNLDAKRLLGGIAAVADVSDEYDDRIVARYGGQRALDRIRDTGGRRRRQERAGPPD
ncbi:MAG: hypothetical protein D6696_09905 [Acidobacteria bacterium]|nr:MAG: hypothetical protein D6696_09905 [Acidobacteriota bacterium]